MLNLAKAEGKQSLFHSWVDSDAKDSLLFSVLGFFEQMKKKFRCPSEFAVAKQGHPGRNFDPITIVFDAHHCDDLPVDFVNPEVLKILRDSIFFHGQDAPRLDLRT